MNSTFVRALPCCVALALGAAPALAQTASTNRANARAAINAASAADRQRMTALLHIPNPGPLPSPADDPKRPPDTHPVGGNSPNWTDGVRGHTDLPDWPTFLKLADKYYKTP